MPALPSGTVTFFLSDIEDSSTLWEVDPDAMRAALARHDELVAEAVADHGGAIVKHMGDGCWAAFSSAPAAAAAAIDFQRRMQQPSEIPGKRLKVRIGLHTGNVDPTEGDYFGPVPNRSARVAGLANGDQIVCSGATAPLLEHLELRSEGLHDLKGIGTAEIFMIHPEGVETDPRPLRHPVAAVNLPVVHSSFVGREADVEHVMGFLTDDRSVVTLLGPGGVGKTRLAIELGGLLTTSQLGIVQFCDLAALPDDESVAPAVAELVGARLQPGMDLLSSIADYMLSRPGVLILDNCEHVMTAVRTLVGRLSSATELLILATSREALGVDGEQVVTVSPLPADTTAVDLFVDRAVQRDASFRLTEENEDDVRSIVRHLDGIPLAIELAAARIRVMSPKEIAERLDDRFRLLGGLHDDERHGTLRSAVAWSYKLLSPTEAALFDRMSVFSGGCALDAIEAICADGEEIRPNDIPDLVASLVDKSMLIGRLVDGRHRFGMLETLRGFARDELEGDESAAVYRRRHADHFRDEARRQSARMCSAAEPDAWRVLDTEWANLRTALDTYEAEGDVDNGAILVIALVWFAATSMRFELFRWADEILEAPDVDEHDAFADLCGAAALGRYFTMDGDPAQVANIGLAADPTDPQGFCRTALAALLLNNLHAPEASEELTAAWLASEPQTVWSQMWAEGFRAFHLASQFAQPEAAKHASAVMRMANETGSISARGLAAWAQGLAVSLNDLDLAIDIWTEGLEWPRSLPGDHLLEDLLVGLILHFKVPQEEPLSALEHCRDALSRAIDRHYYAGTSHLFGVTAIALSRAGDPETGGRLIGAMIGNGHLPRKNALRKLEKELGEDLDTHSMLGMSLSVTQAGHVAIDALDASIERLGSTS